MDEGLQFHLDSFSIFRYILYQRTNGGFTMTKAIGYIRVSTDDQAESGLSLTHQRAKVEAYCIATDLSLVEVIEDAGESAKSMKRPGLQRAMESIRKGEAGALVILKLDRLTRSVRDLK